MDIDNSILSAVTGLLRPYCPQITEAGLRDELKKAEHLFFDEETEIKHPLTRKATACLLNISLNTLNRYMNEGLLRKIKIGPRHVLIDPASINAFIWRSATPDDDKAKTQNNFQEDEQPAKPDFSEVFPADFSGSEDGKKARFETGLDF